jgi:Flp pilus assembly protein TadG
MSYIRNFLKNHRGTMIIEFAYVFPIYLLFIFGIIELGYTLWGDSNMKHAASYASRYAFVNPTATASDINAAALSKIDLSGNPIQFTVTLSGTTVDIDGTFTYNFLVLPIKPITITTHIRQLIPTNI